MSEELVARFVEHVKAKRDAEGSRGGGVRSGACAMLRLELAVLESLICLGRAAVQCLVSELGTGHQGRQVIRDGVVYRFNGYRSKTVHGLYGMLTVQRAYYASSTGLGLTPLDERLGIGHGHTPACEYHVAQFVGNNPYQRSRDHFHQIFRPDGVEEISLHKIEQMVDALGARLEDQRQEEITAVFEDGKGIAVDDEITDTMVVCIDAGKAPTKGNERIDDDNRRRYDREFRDVKVASVSALKWDEGDQEARCSNSSYVLGIEHADQFFQRIWVEMNRRSHDLSTLRLVFIGDGADWIWRRVGDLDNERSRHILDFCHAADHLADVCKILDGEGSDRFYERFKRWRGTLREGGAAELIVELKRLRDTAASSGQRDSIQGEINYFEANRGRMNYRQYRQQHLPIGSGTVESACKNVVAARMKQAGMTWTLEGAQHMLQIRASLMSSRFARDFQNSFPARPDPEELPAAA